MRWSSTLGREVPVGSSSPPKKSSPSKSPSPAKNSPHASKSPPVVEEGAAARGAARNRRGASRKGGPSGATAATTSDFHKHVAVNVKVEEVDEVNEEDGEVVMRQRQASLGGPPRQPMVEVVSSFSLSFSLSLSLSLSLCTYACGFMRSRYLQLHHSL